MTARMIASPPVSRPRREMAEDFAATGLPRLAAGAAGVVLALFSIMYHQAGGFRQIIGNFAPRATPRSPPRWPHRSPRRRRVPAGQSQARGRPRPRADPPPRWGSREVVAAPTRR